MYNIFGVRDAASMLLLRNSLGLPDLSCVIDGRVSNFMDKLDYKFVRVAVMICATLVT